MRYAAVLFAAVALQLGCTHVGVANSDAFTWIHQLNCFPHEDQSVSCRIRLCSAVKGQLTDCSNVGQVFNFTAGQWPSVQAALLADLNR